MYKTRQIIRHDEPIQLPTCMYKMRNVMALESPVHEQETIKQENPGNLNIAQQVNRILKVLYIKYRFAFNFYYFSFRPKAVLTYSI